MKLDFSKNKYLYGIALITGAILLSLLLIFAVIRPSYISNQKISVEIKKKKEELQFLENKLSKLKDLKKEEARLLKEKEIISQALPEEKDVAGLFVQFEKVVSSNASSVLSAGSEAAAATSTEVTSGDSTPGINTHTFSIKLNTSTYGSFKNIIESSEKALRLADIYNISVTEKDNSFDVNLSVKTYSRLQEVK